MSKVAHYLQEHLTGEVIASARVRNHFSTDGSIFKVLPSLVVYPKNENDVRKTARFCWQLAERGRVMPITARSAGTNQSGGAIGSGIIMNFAAHMNRILEYDGKGGTVTAEPGLNYGRLEQTLHTHGRFLPPYPDSLQVSSVGGAVAENSSGERSVKYGPTLQYVKSLRVVLANGEAIEVKKLNKREHSRKLGLATFEGHIYRELDKLLEENSKTVAKTRLNVPHNNAGYNLADVSQKGTFDLTPLFTGSQGTLGIITEATLDTEPYNPASTLLVALFEDAQSVQNAILELLGSADRPSSINLIDGSLLELVDKQNPNLLANVVSKPYANLVLFVEFDDTNAKLQKKLAAKAQKILERYAVSSQTETDVSTQEHLKKIQRAASAAMAHAEGKVALPVIDDGIVPVEHLAEFLDAARQLLSKQRVPAIVSGSAGSGVLHIRPFLDLSEIGDVQKVFRLLSDFCHLVAKFGGSISATNNDGRLRGPFLKDFFGDEVYELFGKVKQIFDPYGILNPGVKINVTLDDVKPLVRTEYTNPHLYQHLQ
jgi:FAD/FMN-containing dehydrogenase